MVKMIDVANHAGVSIKTVSRVVNNEPTVQDEFRVKVLHSIAHLGYVPSTSARTLRSNRSYQINFISDSSRNTFANRVLFGALRTCHDAGYQLVLDLIEPHQQNDQEFTDNWIAKQTLRNKPEGVIVFPPLSLNKRFVRKLIEANIPVVSVGSTSVHDQQGSVTINDREAAKEMTNYLIRRGHRRIGFVLGAKDQSATKARLKGYKAALLEKGIPLDKGLLFKGDFNFESGLAAGEALLLKSDRPTAIFSSNDEMAAGVIFSAQKLGIAIPIDLSVVGFDDNAFAGCLWPRLTTIRQPLEEFGITAMQILSNFRGGVDNIDAVIDKCLDYQFIERNSVTDLSSETIKGK